MLGRCYCARMRLKPRGLLFTGEETARRTLAIRDAVAEGGR